MRWAWWLLGLLGFAVLLLGGFWAWRRHTTGTGAGLSAAQWKTVDGLSVLDGVTGEPYAERVANLRKSLKAYNVPESLYVKTHPGSILTMTEAKYVEQQKLYGEFH